MIPSMWRVELLHPLSVHFPIALLIIGTACRAAGVFPLSRAHDDRSMRAFCYASGQWMTWLGAVTAWPAWYLGTLAEEEVNSQLCDPTITHLHGDYAYIVTLLFTGIAVIETIAWVSRRTSLRVDPLLRLLDSKTLRVLLLLTALGSSALLGYVGHLGASLTYNQGAGVYKPSAECTEFAE